jgi:predicted secreted protein
VDRLARSALALCLLWMAARSPAVQGNGAATPGARPAASIPVHVLTQREAGSVTSVEQGDIIEVRLDEPAPAEAVWRMSRQRGSARIEALGEPARVQEPTGAKRVFRFRALAIGELELAFARRTQAGAAEPERSMTFRLVVR